jgi:hypothetical protein
VGGGSTAVLRRAGVVAATAAALAAVAVGVAVFGLSRLAAGPQEPDVD